MGRNTEIQSEFLYKNDLSIFLKATDVRLSNIRKLTKTSLVVCNQGEIDKLQYVHTSTCMQVLIDDGLTTKKRELIPE